MIQRCGNPNCRDCCNYGGRGIKVCDRWQRSFINFFADMGNRLSGLTLDRKNNNGNYELSNCRWATYKEQENNKRSISCGLRKQRWFYGYGPNGEMIIKNSQCRTARVFGLNQRTISDCLTGKRKQHRGWKFQWIEKSS